MSYYNGGPSTGNYGQYIENNNTASLAVVFNGNFGSLFTGVLQYLRSDLGITQTSGNITAWADQSGNGVNVTPTSGATYIGSVGTGLNGYGSIIADGSTQGGQYTLNFPAPGTTPTFFWAIWRLISAPSVPSVLLDDVSNFAQMIFINQGTTQLYLKSSNNAGPAVIPSNSWGRMEAAMANSSSDYIKFQSSSASGNAGNSATGGQRGIFCSGNGANKLNAELLTLVTLNNIPSPTVLTNALTQANSFYGGSFG